MSWHPDGCAARSAVFGAGLPGKLLPRSSLDASPAKSADLVIVCPSREERGARWVRETLAAAAAALHPDGLLYAILPAAVRRQAVARLACHDLAVVGEIAHLPTLESSRYLVPALERPLQYTLSFLVASRPSMRRAAGLLLGIAGAVQTVRTTFPAVALIARHPGARPLCDWISRIAPDRLGDADGLAERVIVVTPWRSVGGPAVLHVLAGGGDRAAFIIKAAETRDDGTRFSREHAALEQLGPTARGAGARVPEARLAELADGRPLLVQRGLSGRPLAAVIAEQRHRLPAVLAEVAGWIERWNQLTRHVRPLDAATIEREVLGPASRLAPVLDEGDLYRSRLAARCSSLLGRPVPFTARHNDLTMHNVLSGEDGSLGVVDWETAEASGLPGTDLAYAIVDAVAAASNYKDRADAFVRAFTGAGEQAPAIGLLMARHRAALAVPEEVADLAMHACWLHHAANEVRINPAGGPFVRIARQVSRRCSWLEAGA